VSAGVTSVLTAFVDAAVTWSSANAVRVLWEQVGAAGVAAAACLPGLSATLDQHAAAVRDALSAGAGLIGVAALGGYARGLLETAGQQGWRLPERVDWAGADWLVVRLVAVADMARRFGHLPTAAA